MEWWPRRLTVGRIMAVVAILAVILGAELYIRQNGDIDRALVAHHLRQLGDANPTVRANAADDLSRDNPRSFGPVLQTLAGALLGDPDAATRRVAARSLGSALLRAVHAPGRASASQVTLPGAPAAPDPIGTDATEADALRALIRTLDDPQPEVSLAAIHAVGNVAGSRLPFADALDRTAISPLLRLLDAPDAARRGAAIWALARMADPPEEARDRARVMVQRDPDADVRSVAIQALSHAWPTVDLYPILCDRGQHAPTEAERSAALMALNRLPSPPAGMLPELLDWIEATPDAVYVVLNRIGRLGPLARPSLGRLQALAERRLAEQGVAGWAEVVSLMARIDPNAPESQAMLPRIDEMLRVSSHRGDWASRGASLLASFGPAAAPLVPAWQARLGSFDVQERRRAAKHLAWIGAPAVGALADLEALDRAGYDPEIREALVDLRRSIPPPPTTPP